MYKFTNCLIVIVALLLAASLTAEIPQTINYQGMLTDSNGPVTDTVSMTFTIYDADTLGNSKWTEIHPSVSVVGGLFNVVLGQGSPPVPIEGAVFSGANRWLEIVVEGETITPRVKLTSIGHAYHSLRADTADYALAGSGGLTEQQADTLYVNESGDILTGELSIDFGDNGNVDALFAEASGPSCNLELYDNGSLKTILWGEDYGTLLLGDSDNDQAVTLDATSNSGGQLYLTQEDGTSGVVLRGGSTSNGATLTMRAANGSVTVSFDADLTGDGAAVLPQSSIQNWEIMDEPGVASSILSSGISLDGTLQTLRSRTITVPAPGYVLVIGSLQADVSHIYGTASNAVFGVSNDAASLPANQDVECEIASPAPGGGYTFPVTVHGLFTASAGSTTYYLLAQEYHDNWTVSDLQLTLVFFPSAYGTVSSTGAAYSIGGTDDDVVSGLAMTPEDIATEQAEAEAFNSARIERELAQMRADRARLEARLQQIEQEVRRTRRGGELK